jgi:hypothetical protein
MSRVQTLEPVIDHSVRIGGSDIKIFGGLIVIGPTTGRLVVMTE